MNFHKTFIKSDVILLLSNLIKGRQKVKSLNPSLNSQKLHLKVSLNLSVNNFHSFNDNNFFINQCSQTLCSHSCEQYF